MKTIPPKLKTSGIKIQQTLETYMKKTIILLLIMFSLQACEDCGECVTPPQTFTFNIVDKKSGENLFTNGSHHPKNITIINTINNKPVDFQFISENNVNLLRVGSVGWKTETVHLKVSISNKNIFDFYVNAERKTDKCCSFTTFKEIKITKSAFKFNKQTGVYKILVE